MLKAMLSDDRCKRDLEDKLLRHRPNIPVLRIRIRTDRHSVCPPDLDPASEYGSGSSYLVFNHWRQKPKFTFTVSAKFSEAITHVVTQVVEVSSTKSKPNYSLGAKASFRYLRK
jgi:hypothetical protein